MERFRVGRYLVDLDRRVILDGDTELDVHWRSFEALRLLIRASGAVVEREAFQDALWPGTVVEESNLHKYLSKLRKVLESGDAGATYIETVPRRGYRLCIDVSPVVDSAMPYSPAPVHTTQLWPYLQKWQIVLLIAVVAGIVAGIVAGAATWRERQSKTRPERVAAEAAYKKGMSLLRERSLPSVRSGTNELRRAVELDPKFARVWAGLAESAFLISPADSDDSLATARRSLSLDPDCGECHAILGFVLYAKYWQWKEGGEHLRKALGLCPSDPQIRYWAAMWEVSQGQVREGLERAQSAIREFPQFANLRVLESLALYMNRDFKGSIRAAERLESLNLTSGFEWKSNSLFQLGRHAEGVTCLHYFLGSWTSASPEMISKRASDARSRFESAGLKGVLGDLLDLTHGLRIQSHNRARWYMLLGEHELALRELEIALDARVSDLTYLKVDPIFDPIRTRPEFGRLLHAVGLDSN